MSLTQLIILLQQEIFIIPPLLLVEANVHKMFVFKTSKSQVSRLKRYPIPQLPKPKMNC